VVGIPVRVWVVRIVPTFVISVVMPIATIVSVFDIAFVLPVVVAVVPVMMVIAILIWGGDRQRSGQSQEHCARYHFAHKSSLQKWRCQPIFLTYMAPSWPVRPSAGRRVIYTLSLRPAISFQKHEILVIHSVHPSTSLTAGSRTFQKAGISSLVRHALTPYNPANPEVALLKRFFFLALLAVGAFTPMPSCAQQVSQEKAPQEKEQVLWQKLEATIGGVDRNLDGVLGVAILDLTTGQKYLLHADEVLPTASSIKIAILAEFYHQAQQGKIKLNDLYTLQSADLVGGSGVAGALTPGVTRLTLRDVAALMISVSDNSATNVIIDRIGMENVNALLDSLGLTHTRLCRKMMDVKAAAEGRENIATPREMMQLLEDLYRGKVLNKQFTEEFFNLLSIHKESYIPRELPEDLRVANKPGELEGVRNDSGIVFAGKRPYVISVMTTYLRREHDGGEAIIRISNAAYQMFDRLSRASEYGRVVSAHDTGNP